MGYEEMVEYAKITIYNLYFNDENICRTCGGISWEPNSDEDIIEIEKDEETEKEETKSEKTYERTEEPNGSSVHATIRAELNKKTKQHIKIRFHFDDSSIPRINAEGIALIKLKNEIEEINQEIIDYIGDELLNHMIKIVDKISEKEITRGKGDNSGSSSD